MFIQLKFDQTLLVKKKKKKIEHKNPSEFALIKKKLQHLKI